MRLVNCFKSYKKKSGFAKRALCGVVSLCLCAAFTAGPISASAASQADVDALQDKIDAAQDKIDRLEREKEQYENDNAAYVERLSAQLDAYELKIDYLEKETDELRENISSLQDRIDEVTANIAQLQKRIEENQAEFDASYDTYCARLRAMYVSGSVTELEVLLTSGDISSMLTRAEMLQSVSEQDSEILQGLMDIMEKIEEDRQTLTKEKTQLDEDKASLEEQKAQMEENLAEAKSENSKYESALAEYNAKIASFNSGISSARQSKKEYEKEQAEIEAEIREAEKHYSGGNYNTGTGTLAWPTYSHSISAGFPTYPSGGPHTGVDFPVPIGTAVHAADDGVVITVKRLTTSYGRYIVISHGNGMQTLYAHNSDLLVSVGQNVTKGQLIAYSGSTGNSSGPHCHFEVRINGKAVNPMNYLR